MSQQSEKQSLFWRVFRYFSGINTSNKIDKGLQFTIGSLNIFLAIVIAILSFWAIQITFPNGGDWYAWLGGFVIASLVLVLNRQTIQVISSQADDQKLRNLSLVPILLFAILIGFIISTPLKFNLFNIELVDIVERIQNLDSKTDASVSSKIISWGITAIIILIVAVPSLIVTFVTQKGFQKNRSTLLNEFMWFCSGANKEILRKCPNEHAKYFGIGGTILFTALMASLSGGYAFSTIFKENTGLAICFGIFWGCMIFNLDRFIVNTMYSDGKHTISWQEFWGGFPRIVIAIFLGIVISNPLELRIFEKEINYEIEQIKNEKSDDQKLAKITAEFDHLKLDKTRKEEEKEKLQKTSTANYNVSITERISQISIEISEKQRSISSYNSTLNNLRKKISNIQSQGDDIAEKSQIELRNLQNQQLRVSQNIKSVERDLNNLIIEKSNLEENVRGDIQEALTRLGDEIIDIDLRIKNKEKEIADYQREIGAIAKNYDGYMAHMEAFSNLRNDEENKTVNIVAWFITFLFIIIEVCPVLFKMMVSSGEYDVMLNTESELLKAKEAVRLSERNDWANTEITKFVEENKKKIQEKQNELNAELMSSQELLSSIAKAQAEIANIAIEKWKEEEMKKAIENPEHFIQSNQTTNPSV